MKKYYIRDVEKLTGIKAHTLRMWEQRYNLMTPHRTETNIRYYDEEQLKLLLNVSLLLSNGYKISKISALSSEELLETVRETYQNAQEEETVSDIATKMLINSLVMAMMEYDEVKFEKIFSTSILRRGVENTVLEIIDPFVNRMDIMWRIGDMDNGQQHFMYYLIRQKIIVAIDAIPIAPQNAPKYLLFLPEAEYRDLYILIYMYMLKTHEKRIINLGQDISLEVLKSISEVTEPDVLMTFFSYPASLDKIQQYVYRLSHAFPNKKILAAGTVDFLDKLDSPSNFIHIKSLEEFRNMLLNIPAYGVLRNMRL